jgi:hypothetical protein
MTTSQDGAAPEHPLEEVYDIKEWCLRRKISPPYFYKMQREGRGPRVIRPGRRTLITATADRDWLRELEAAQQS